jgi:hypothetical protein
MKPEGSAMSVLNTAHSQVGDLALKVQREIIIRLYSGESAPQCAGTQSTIYGIPCSIGMLPACSEYNKP